MTRSAAADAQGTGFIHLRDPDRMRVILLWEVRLPQGWAGAFDGWRPRPLNLRAHDRNGKMQYSYRGRRASYFHPEVADRLLGLSRQEAGREAGESSARAVDRRRSLALPVLVDHHDGEAVTLRIGALEALRVTDGEGACEAILVLHAEVPDPDYLRHYLTVANSASLSEVGATIEAVLAEVCGPGKVSLASDRSDRSGWVGAPLFTITWVPLGVSSAWLPAPGESAEEMCERLGMPVSVEVVEDIRSCGPTGGAGNGTGDAAGAGSGTGEAGGAGRLPVPVLAGAGWQWGSLPSPTGHELGEGQYAAALAGTHVLSQSWAVSVWEHGVAYLPRQRDSFLCEGMLKMCSTDLDVYLLVALDRLRVRALSRSLARVAQELREAITSRELLPTASGVGASAPGGHAYDDLISKAIALDADAVAFLASEWWTDITNHWQADMILAWMQDAGRLDDAVAQVVEQSRLLRESVQTLIERQEHLLDQERQRSARVMEGALAILAFVGIPLTVLLEIWVNWTPVGIGERGWGWWLWLVGVLAGAGAIGVLLARLFGVRLWPSARHLWLRGRRGPRR